ncbi:MAG: sugar phosphate isomerase/epimerase, partial [Verrucomicrobiae bacterium]|nr:sugar phosphate isomerase/epimerase [Verrucomicrobiae bacterium]
DKDPKGNTKKIIATFKEAAKVAKDHGERLAAEGEICWGGMHSWRRVVELLQAVDRPKTLGFQADMAHTLLFLMGYNAPEDALLPQDYDWKDKALLDEAMRKLTDQLRPWTIDFHVAQNDATVKGSGTHDKTGHHCLPTDPNGKLDIPHHAGFWLRDANGNLTRAFKHICWDGCMFPNKVMMEPKTWTDILGVMIAGRDAHGWTESLPSTVEPAAGAVEITPSKEKPAKPAPPTKRKKTTMATVKKKTSTKAKKSARKASTKKAGKPTKQSTKGSAKSRPGKKTR